MVRLRYGFIIRCDEVIKDEQGDVIELKCSVIEDSRSGRDNSGVKPNGVIHWVSAPTAKAVSVNIYERLFKVAAPKADTFIEDINPNSLKVIQAWVEPELFNHSSEHFQFERQGYFCRDNSRQDVFNKTVSLREGF